MIQIVSDQIVGSGYFHRLRWRKSVEWEIPDGVCAPGMGGWYFRNTLKGDVEKSQPMKMPVLSDARHGSSHRRQQKGYVLLKKMLVDKDGIVYRATDAEIVEALGGVDEDDGIGDLTGPEYVFAVSTMFHRRR